MSIRERENQLDVVGFAVARSGVVGVWMEDAVLDSLRYIDSLSRSMELDEMEYDESADSGRGELAPSAPFPSVSSERV